MDIQTTLEQLCAAYGPSGFEGPVAELAQKLEEKGKQEGLSIRLQREEIFQAMHRV